jgi:hypothetical protein
MRARAGDATASGGDPPFVPEPERWPLAASPADATTWDHVELAVRYLFDRVGTGPHSAWCGSRAATGMTASSSARPIAFGRL